MGLEKGRIASSQLKYLIIGFTLGTSILLTPGTQAKHDAWIAVLVGLAEGMVFALVYSLLALRFQGKTFIQVSDTVYGPYLGKLVSVTFLWFLFHSASLSLGVFSSFFTGLIMPETPAAVFAILITLVCAWAVRNGVEVIARCSQMLVPLTILSIITTAVLLVKDFDVKKFQPVLEVPPGQLLWAAHGAAMLPFASTVAFLMVIPFVNNSREIIPSVAKGLIIAGFMLTLAAIQTIGTLGVTAGIFTYPAFQAVRLIDIAHILTRLEIIVGINLTTMGFLRTSVFFYGTVLGTAQLLGLRSYRLLVSPVGILIVILSLINYKSITENFEDIKTTWPLYTLPFEAGLPLFTLLLAVLRKLPREES